MKNIIGTASSFAAVVVFTFIACLPDTAPAAASVLMYLALASAAAFVVFVNLATGNVRNEYKEASARTSEKSIRKAA